MRPYEIMLVDDDPLVLLSMGEALENEGYVVVRADSGEMALGQLAGNRFDLVMTDLVMREIDGLSVLHRAKELYPDVPVLILTGYGDLNTAVEALRARADDYLLKPCALEEILFRVSRCIDRLELERKLKLYESMLPVCCVCKRIRDDTHQLPGTGSWVEMENYLHSRGHIEVTSTYCPTCYTAATRELSD